MIKINLTVQEITDLRTALIIAMQKLDQPGETDAADKILSDRLEQLEIKFLNSKIS